jgi:hypothetical protein
MSDLILCQKARNSRGFLDRSGCVELSVHAGLIVRGWDRFIGMHAYLRNPAGSFLQAISTGLAKVRLLACWRTTVLRQLNRCGFASVVSPNLLPPQP